MLRAISDASLIAHSSGKSDSEIDQEDGNNSSGDDGGWAYEDEEDEEGEDNKSKVAVERLSFLEKRLKRAFVQKNTPSSPLPLYHFKPNMVDYGVAKTVWGHVIPSIRNTFCDGPGAGAGQDGALHSPLHSRRLSKWFIARAHKEHTCRQLENRTAAAHTSKSSTWCRLVDAVVFQSDGIFDLSQPGAESTAGAAVAAAPSSSLSSSSSSSSSAAATAAEACLEFDSGFESGNLEKATRVVGRQNLMTARALDCLRGHIEPESVHHEYDLVIRRDLNTTGNIQWFYFAAKAPPSSVDLPIKYPLRVRFNLVNMEKKDSLYNFGMRPATHILQDPGFDQGWRNRGDDVCYFKNGKSVLKSTKGPDKPKGGKDGKGGGGGGVRICYLHTLAFTFTFDSPGTVYFAHCYPYTYSDLQSYLLSLEQDERVAKLLKRTLLCKTVCGNRCDLLTITGRCVDVRLQLQRPAVVISARIHPGETNSSYVCHGIIEFLCADTPEAALLRDTYVFKVIPMMNPDGVIHGNYRCSIVGTDLNRRFGDVHPHLHPTVYAMRHLLHKTHTKRGILLYLDLHGHSKKKNAFLYGCDVLQQPDRFTVAAHGAKSSEEIALQRIFARVYPKILCSLNRTDCLGRGFFSYNDCTFSVSGDKGGTGRVISWRNLGIQAAYTVEVSFCGGGDNKERHILNRCDKGDASSGSGSGRAGGGSNVRGTAAANDDGREKTEEEVEVEVEAATASSGPNTARSSGDCGSPSRQTKVAALETGDLAARDTLLRNYQRQRHYAKRDLQNMGRDICLALFHFSNLRKDGIKFRDPIEKMCNKPPPTTTPSATAAVESTTTTTSIAATTNITTSTMKTEVAAAVVQQATGVDEAPKRRRKKSLSKKKRESVVGQGRRKTLTDADKALASAPFELGTPRPQPLLFCPDLGTNDCTSGITPLATLVHTRVLRPAVLEPQALNAMLLDLAATVGMMACSDGAGILAGTAPSILLGSTGIADPNHQSLGLGAAPSLPHLGMGLRASSELSIRRMLGLTEGIVLPDDEDDDGVEGASSDGSDSEPSVDNVRIEKDVHGKKFAYLDFKTLRASVRDVTRQTVLRYKAVAAEEEAMRRAEGAVNSTLKVSAPSERLQQGRPDISKKSNILKRERPDLRRNASLPILSTVNLNDIDPSQTSAPNPYQECYDQAPVVPTIPAWSLRNKGRRNSFNGRLSTVSPMLQIPGAVLDEDNVHSYGSSTNNGREGNGGGNRGASAPNSTGERGRVVRASSKAAQAAQHVQMDQGRGGASQVYLMAMLTGQTS